MTSILPTTPLQSDSHSYVTLYHVFPDHFYIVSPDEGDAKAEESPLRSVRSLSEESASQIYERYDDSGNSHLFPYTEDRPLPDMGICCEYGGMLPDDPEFDEEGNIVGIIGLCPNASNPYHECTEYCQKRWGSILFQTEPSSNPPESQTSTSELPESTVTTLYLSNDGSADLIDEETQIGPSSVDFPEPILQSLHFTSGEFCLTMINSFMDQFVPVAKATFQIGHLDLTDWSHNLNFLVKMDVGVEYFNNQREVWEPVIESWNMLFKVREREEGEMFPFFNI